jgi:hypothetical protein
MPRFGQRPHTPLPRPRWPRPDLTASLSAPRERQRITRARSNSPSRTATSRGHRRQREVGGPHLRLAPRAHVTAGEIQRSVTRWIATDIGPPATAPGSVGFWLSDLGRRVRTLLPAITFPATGCYRVSTAPLEKPCKCPRWSTRLFAAHQREKLRRDGAFRYPSTRGRVMGDTGLEPVTSALSRRRSPS